ncbi:MAG: TerC family protein, partial [Actinobacteria bacterium]|nr:TerC family protein [Actinomycetota bacterium]
MVSLTTWFITIGVLVFVIAFDLALAVARRNKETSLFEAAFWTIFYIGAAIVFGFLLPHWSEPLAQKEFFAGWLTEYA